MRYARQFDRVTADPFSLRVDEKGLENAQHQVPKAFWTALKTAHRNITQYHKLQRPKGWRRSKNGVMYGVQYTAIESVGLYVPGGRAIYPSSVLMNAIPAQIAGVPNIVMATPPQPDGSIPPQILAAAALCGVSTIVKSGGAQAVFALAYGTQSVPKVDKIVGPGNKYVDGAKQRVYGIVDIDKPAGPSEVLVYLTDPQYAPFAAAELLAQLEHDPDASAIAVSENPAALSAVASALEVLVTQCARQTILNQSIVNCALVSTESHSESVRVINDIASEHLVVLTDDAVNLLPQIRNGGSIFLGPYTPVALGDYVAGPNHVLPTGRAARFASPLGVMDFMKYSSFLQYSEPALVAVAPAVKVLTDMEGFDAHYLSVSVRTGKK
ncbi:histidinol dehydrogenase [bacterium]|nr:histidinol dehydrogenase [bacterium]